MLTAIVPVSDMAGRLHNLENWLKKIHHLDIQVIIVHDYRDSKTEKELLSILEALNSQRIVFLTGTFGSPGAARNAGLERVQSKFVCFWDSDDLPDPQSIVSELAIYSEVCDVLVGQYLRCSEHSVGFKQIKSLDTSLRDVAMNPGLWRMVFCREFISSIRFQKMRMGEDQLFLSEVVSQKPRISFTNTVFYNYNVGHPEQLTQNLTAISELHEAFRQILNLRKKANGKQFEFYSIIISRMNLTLAKFAFKNGTKFLTFRYIMSRSNLITRHPILQIKCALLVIHHIFKEVKLA